MNVTTCLWFDGTAAEATELYVNTFPDAHITDTSYYPEGSDVPAGTVLAVSFELGGQHFLALNAGPGVEHTPAISFQVPCHTQAEIDHYWDALLADGGTESWCGWLSDRYGVSWQIVPDEPILHPEDSPAANERVNLAMQKMHKLDLAALEAARRL